MQFFLHPLWLKRKLQLLVEELFQYRIYIYPNRTHGHQEIADIKRVGWPINIIFDIGANIGQTALKFKAAFPNASIHSFEPVQKTYRELTQNLTGANVNCHNLALGSSPGKATIYLGDYSTTNTLIDPGVSQSQETVDISTVDSVLNALNIDSIDLLKIDAEGYDMEVLKGADSALSQGKIAFVLVEVVFHQLERSLVSFSSVQDFLGDRGFTVFGFYDQTPEWDGKHRLRYANALFIHKDLYNFKN